MTNLDSILKSRDITLPTKVCLVKAMVFPVVMYGCESWIIKKAECRRIDVLELWCWRRLLHWKEIKPVDSRGNQSWVFIGRTDADAETPVLWPPNAKKSFPDSWKRPWCWERSKAGGEGDDRGWDGWMASPTQWTGVWINSGGWWWAGRPGVLRSMGSQGVRHDWATELKPHPLCPNQVLPCSLYPPSFPGQKPAHLPQISLSFFSTSKQSKKSDAFYALLASLEAVPSFLRIRTQ